MGAQYTPGPWRALRDRTVISRDALIADCRPNDGLTQEEADANARLIAAAPDMLAVLRGIEWCGPKRRGHSSCPECRQIRIGGSGDHTTGCRVHAAIAKAEGC